MKRELRTGDIVEVRYTRLYDPDLWALGQVVSIEPDKLGVLMMSGPDTGKHRALPTCEQGRMWRT
jgi:hypothetical protein